MGSSISLLDAKDLAPIAKIGFGKAGDKVVNVRGHAPILGCTLIPSKTGILATSGNFLCGEDGEGLNWCKKKEGAYAALLLEEE